MPKQTAEHLNDQVIALAFELSGEEAPTEVRLLPAGSFDTTKGTFTFDANSALSVLNDAEDWGNDYSFDYEHAAVLGVNPAPAAGWYQLEMRDGELWATDIRWTDKAEQMILGREYRYTSPAFGVDQDNRVTRYINTALTNLPATKRHQPLIAAAVLPGETHDPTRGSIPHGAGEHRDEREDRMEAVMKALNLKPEASEEAAVDAITALHVEQRLVQALSGVIPEGADVIGTITAWRDGAAQAEQLSARLEAIEADAEAARVDQLLEQGVKDRKLTPASVQALRAALADQGTGRIDASRVEAYLAAAPKIAALTGTATEPTGNSDAPGAQVLTVETTEWEALSNIERAQLRQTDPDEFDRILRDHRAARY